MSDSPRVTPGPLSVARRSSPPARQIRSGADLVELGERLYTRLFGVALAMVLGGVVISIGLSLADPATRGEVPRACLLAVPLSIVVVLALRSLAVAYRLLRSNAWTQLIPAAIGALLSFTDANPPFWFASMAAILVTTVLAGSVRVTMLAGAANIACYAADLALHAESLTPQDDLTYPTAMAGFFTNGLLAAAFIGWLARFVLTLHRFQADAYQPQSPMRVHARPSARGGAAASRPGPQTAPTVKRRHGHALTARQLEVALLVRDGLHYAEIAACLAISRGQVENLIGQAKRRVGAKTTSELIAMLVQDRLVPIPLS